MANARYHCHQDNIKERRRYGDTGLLVCVCIGRLFWFSRTDLRFQIGTMTGELLQSEDSTHMERTAFSPDLNLIEHVKDMPNR
ncbi:hypothetical protein TNCV_1885231 [Trichonephila clavipes]|nr:hypothetical protein TNCV_1885231 [Trichonephila clavipes]